MEMTDLCKELNNWFHKKIYIGKFTIADGVLTGNFSLQDGQYFRICDSVFNDGVYQHPASGLIDEVFEGAVWAMAVPPTVIALQAEIDDWLTDEGVQKALKSPYTSESFGGYSYTKAGGKSSDTGENKGLTWQSQFADQLNRWRKI